MFTITTPIYYVNDEPHLGHAYSTILADVLAGYHRLRGEETLFVTGVDEHGQKVEAAVRRQGIENPQAYVDAMAERFEQVWKALNISYHDFLRTTQPRHVQVVEAVLQDLWQRGEIYRGQYAGWYCVPDERFWTEKDLVVGACPDCGRPVEQIIEANYFFRMSKYQGRLLAYLDDHPDFIQPLHRQKEVLGFLRQPLGDLCISRPRSRLQWGIPLPFDREYVTYVWFDALLNYITATGYRADPKRFARQWPETVHLIGKDILTTHSVYWTTMLFAMGLPLPKTIFAHGWWMVEGQKMGKSLGNAVRPLALAQEIGLDAFRYFLMSEMQPGQDADFRAERLAERYTVDLANTFGNLLQRVTSMTSRYLNGRLAAPEAESEAEGAVQQVIAELPQRVFAAMDAFRVPAALQEITQCLAMVNGYLERTAPWAQAKQGNTARVATILYTAAEALRLCSLLLVPVMPEKAGESLHRLGGDASPGGLRWGVLSVGQQLSMGAPLFPRIFER